MHVHPGVSVFHRRLIDEVDGFRAFADSLPQLVWIAAPDGSPIYLNQRWFAYAGVSTAPIDEALWLPSIHPDDVAQAWSRWQHSLETGAPYEAEFRLRRHDGVYRWFLARAAAEPAGHGAIQRWLGTCTDIDSIRSAHAELRTRESDLQLVLDLVPVLIARIDREHRYLFVNRPFAARFGLEPHDCVGRRMPDIVGEDAYQNLRADVQRGLAGEKTAAEREVDFAGRLGRRFMRWVSAPERDASGAVRSMVVAISDHTEHRQADLARAQSLERLRALMNSIPDEIWFIDAEGRHLEVNAAGRRNFGLSANDAGDLKRMAETLELIRPDGTRLRLEDAPSQRALRGEVVENEEYFLRVPRTGARQRRQVTASPVRDGRGEIIGSVSVVRDVTAMRESENALRASEERYRLLAETMLHGVVHQNADGDIIAMNPAAERIMGRNRIQIMGSSSERLQHQTIREDGSLFPGADHPAMQALRTGRPVRDVVMGVFIPQSDTYRWIRIDAVPLGTKDGARPAEVYTVFQDITERKEAEEQLRKSQAQLRAALRSMNDAVFISDAEGRFIEFNDAFVSYHRYENAQQCAKSFAEYPHILDVFMPDGRLAAVEEWAVTRALRGETATNAEYTLRRKDTGETWIGNYAFAPIRDPSGAIVGSVVTARDVTERHRAEVALRESESRLRLALDAAQAGIWECWPSTGTFVASERALALHGLPPGTTMDVSSAMVQIHPEDRARVDEALRATLATGVPYRVEIRAVQPDGSSRWLVSHAELQPSAKDTKLVGLVQDITERKLAEEALRVAARQKDEFLAMLAHELRNPLAPIRSATEILARLLADAPATVAPLAIIRRQTHILTRLVDDLLDVARIAQGRIELRKERLSAVVIIQQAIETINSLISEKGHRLHVHVDDDLYVHGDPARLAQCVCNVLHNAAKYTDVAGDLWLEARADGDTAVFEVRDNGHGITADLLPHVFDLFVQSERTLDRSEGGLGVGLSVVKRLVDLHGGTVTVASDGADRGATFRISLPRVDPADSPAVLQPRKAPRRRVLIVDDNADAADSLAMLLRFDSHDVETVYTAPAALETAARMRPEIIFLDIGLPQMDGYEVARRLRAMPEVGRAQLVALTGYGRSEDRELTHAAGFDAHFVKPIDFADVEAILGIEPFS